MDTPKLNIKGTQYEGMFSGSTFAPTTTGGITLAPTSAVNSYYGTNIPTTTNTPTAPTQTATPTVVTPTPPTVTPISPTSGLNLDARQIGLLKTNNPTLYNTLYGSTPAEVNVEDIGTTGITSNGVGNTGTTGLDASFDEAVTNAERDAATTAQEGTPMDARDTAFQNWLQASELLTGRATGEKEIKEGMGVFAEEEKAMEAKKAYEDAVIAQRRRIAEMRQNPEGMLAGALDASIQNYKYESDQNIADLAMTSYYSQGKYDMVTRMAQEAIDAQYKPIEALMTHYKDMYTLLGDDMTESEKMRFQYQLNVAEANITAVRDAKTEAVRAAGINGATPDVLSAIKNAQSVEDVWTAAGSYGIDPNLKLAQDKFAWDKWFAQTQLATKNAEEADAEGANMANLLRQTGKLSQAVGEALGNRVGLAAATGTIKGGWSGVGYAVPGAVAGAVIAGPVGAAIGTGAGWFGGAANAIRERENFENDIKLIYAAQALTELGKLGYSLAPITEREIEMVGSMASNLSSSVRIAEDGSVTISGSTSEFRKNLEELQTQLSNTMQTMKSDPTLARYLASMDDADITSAYNQP